MEIQKKLCPFGQKGNPNRDLKSIDYITIHCTGNYSATATAKSHANLQYRGGSEASWHYTVDKDEIWQSFEDNRECWHAGDGNSGPGNYTSIGIEICVNDRDGFRQACENSAFLTSELLKKYCLPIDRVVQHNRWAAKDCPHELRSGCWDITWTDFIEMTEKYMLPESPREAVTPSQEPSSWAEDAWEWGSATGIVDGTNPRDYATREQVVTMLHRFYVKNNKPL